jgi:hypothetical protein
VRHAREGSSYLIFEKTISIGLMSGEYGGGNSSRAREDSNNPRVAPLGVCRF